MALWNGWRKPKMGKCVSQSLKAFASCVYRSKCLSTARLIVLLGGLVP